MIELMVVVSIIGIVVALSMPNVKNWIARYQLKQAILELQSNLNLARMAAMNRNMTITTTLQIANGRVVATFTDPANTAAGCLANINACALPTQTMPGQVTGIGATTSVAFNSLGLRTPGGTANTALQLINSGGVTYSIGITPSGRTAWCAAAAC